MEGDVTNLTPSQIAWIQRALYIKYGEVVLKIHEGDIVGIDTKERRKVK